MTGAKYSFSISDQLNVFFSSTAQAIVTYVKVEQDNQDLPTPALAGKLLKKFFLHTADSQVPSSLLHF